LNRVRDTGGQAGDPGRSLRVRDSHAQPIGWRAAAGADQSVAYVVAFRFPTHGFYRHRQYSRNRLIHAADRRLIQLASRGSDARPRRQSAAEEDVHIVLAVELDVQCDGPNDPDDFLAEMITERDSFLTAITGVRNRSRVSVQLRLE